MTTETPRQEKAVPDPTRGKTQAPTNFETNSTGQARVLPKHARRPHLGRGSWTQGLSISLLAYAAEIAYMNQLEQIFGELGISHYLETFVDQGFDTWETILDITESDL